MKRRDVHGLILQAVIVVVAVVFLAFASTALTDMAKKIAPDTMRLLVTVAAIAFSGVVFADLVWSHFERVAHARRMESKLAVIEGSVGALSEDVEDVIDMATKTGPIKGFLVSAKMMLKEESSMSSGEVWVYTPELTVDISERFSRVIAENIERGIAYRYFLPDVPDRRADFEILVSNVCEYAGKQPDEFCDELNVCWLPSTLSRPGGMTVHVSDGQNRRVSGFTTIPYEKWGNDFFIRMDDTYAARALQYLRSLDDDYGTA